MSCSSKYEKLVEYIKTQREVYANIIGFVDSLESEETISNFTMPDHDINISDSLSIGTASTAFDNPNYYASIDTSSLDDDLFASMDGVDIVGLSTSNEEVFTVPSPIDELTGLNITTDKDDK
tara:strand:- start:6 stop:371 length:366 start_codon:yes stop_codon:yes gene_type:complete